MIADSAQYYAAATALAAHGTLNVPIAFSAHEQFDTAGRLVTSHPFVLWPPGYPMALALVSRLRVVLGRTEVLHPTDIATAAAIVNLVALVVTLLAVAWLVDRAAGPVTAIAVATLFGVLPVVQSVFRMGLSEGLFLAFCALSVVAMTLWLEDPARHTLAPWGAALAIGAAMHVRYTGVFLVPVHVACAIWAEQKSRATSALRRSWTSRLSCLAGLLIGSAFLWYRLATLGCMLCEDRPASTQPFVLNVRDLGTAVAKSLPAVYELVPGPFDVAVSLGALAVLILLQPRDRSSRPAGRSEAFAVSAIFAATYALGVLALRTVVEFNSLDPRLVAPTAFVANAIVLTLVLKPMARAGQWRVVALGVVMFGTAGILSDRMDLARADSRTHWRGLSDPSTCDLAIVRYARDHFARRPAVPLFTSDGSILQTQIGYEAPIYYLPQQGAPLLMAGEHGVAVLRKLASTRSEAQIQALDAAATRIAENEDIIAWELAGR
jgi:4-amino-4-deoxy-L-arabinose transferase-like glycosyltransferase